MLVLLALSAPAALVASLVDAAWSPWLMAFAATTFPVALMALGTARGRVGWLRWPLLGLWLVLAGSWAFLLSRPQGDLGALPVGTAVMLFVMVPVPFAIVCWAYARSFSSLGLRDEDLERLRRLRRKD